MATDRLFRRDLSRRNFLKSGAAGLAGGTAVGAVACRTAAGNPGATTTSPAQPAGLRGATDLQNIVGDGSKRRILLRGGVVLSLDRKLGDFASATY